MSRFFFNVFNGSHANDSDDVGQELPDQEAAQSVAARYAGDLLRDQDCDLSPGTDLRLEVRTESSTCIYRITVKASDGP
jgi:hypothetical protein